MSECPHETEISGESWIEQDSYGLFCSHCSQRWVRMGGKMDNLREEIEELRSQFASERQLREKLVAMLQSLLDEQSDASWPTKEVRELLAIARADAPRKDSPEGKG